MSIVPPRRVYVTIRILWWRQRNSQEYAECNVNLLFASDVSSAIPPYSKSVRQRTYMTCCAFELTTGFAVCSKLNIQAHSHPVARILLADGNDKLRSLVRAVIETRDGWSVCEAKDGHDAVSKALELKPDLVVLDFAMGGLNGLQAAATIIAACPNLPTILYTFYDFPQMVVEAKKVGIREVVCKGESGDRLLEAIEKHLERRAKSATVLPTDTKIADAPIKEEPPV
jgi:CheY-like chemotaxis protein